MSIEIIALNTYFAVEAKPNETSRAVAHLVCKTADDVRTLFLRLEVQDVILVGGRRFIRMRSDLLNPYPMLERVFERGRAIITMGLRGDYEVKFVDGRQGPVSNLTMHSLPRLGQRVTFRGPKVKLWERQFE